MRTLCVCFVLFSAAASAQSGPVATEVESSWRTGVDGGLAAVGLTRVAAVSVERSGPSRFGVGLRAWATAGPGGFEDDGAFMDAGGGEAYAVAQTGGRWAEVRARVGAGLTWLDYSPGGLRCEPGYGTCPPAPEGFQPYMLAGLVLDLYPIRQVGVGAELRAAFMEGPANVTMLTAGLRVRL